MKSLKCLPGQKISLNRSNLNLRRKGHLCLISMVNRQKLLIRTGELKFQNGVYYGQVKNIKPNGKGKMIFKDYYELGYFVDGKKNGYCMTVRKIGII